MACTVPHTSFSPTTTASAVVTVIMSSLPQSQQQSVPANAKPSNTSSSPLLMEVETMANDNNKSTTTDDLNYKKRCRSSSDNHNSSNSILCSDDDNSASEMNNNINSSSSNKRICTNSNNHNKKADGNEEQHQKQKEQEEELPFYQQQQEQQQLQEHAQEEEEEERQSDEQLLSTEQIHSLLDNVNIPSYSNSKNVLLPSSSLPQSSLSLSNCNSTCNDNGNEKNNDENDVHDCNNNHDENENNIHCDMKDDYKVISQQSEARPIPSAGISTQSVPSSPAKATTVNKLKSSQLPPLPTSTQKQTLKQQKHKSISKLQTSTKLSTPSKENHQPMKTAITTTNPLSTPSSTKNSTQSLPKTTTTPSSTSSSSSSGRWTKAEHEAFLDGLKIHGREWKKVAQNIPTRTSAQIRSHAQKYFAKLARDEQQHHHQQVAMLWCSNSSGGGGSIGVGTNNSIGGDGLGLASPLSKAIGHDDSNYCNEHQLCHHANLTQSVLERVEKILKDPEGAQLEVEQTLQRLRKRYNELQQKVREKQAAKRAAAALNATREGNHGSDDGNDEHLDLKYPMGVLRQKANYKLDDGHLSSSLPKHSATTTPIVTFSQEESNKSNIHQTAKTIGASVETTRHNQKITSEATTTATHHRLRNDLLASKELIALHVLGGELYRSGSKENLTSATQNGHNGNNHISNDNNNNDKQYDNNDSSGEDKNDNKTKKSTMN